MHSKHRKIHKELCMQNNHELLYDPMAIYSVKLKMEKFKNQNQLQQTYVILYGLYSWPIGT